MTLLQTRGSLLRVDLGSAPSVLVLGAGLEDKHHTAVITVVRVRQVSPGALWLQMGGWVLCPPGWPKGYRSLWGLDWGLSCPAVSLVLGDPGLQGLSFRRLLQTAAWPWAGCLASHLKVQIRYRVVGKTKHVTEPGIARTENTATALAACFGGDLKSLPILSLFPRTSRDASRQHQLPHLVGLSQGALGCHVPPLEAVLGPSSW